MKRERIFLAGLRLARTCDWIQVGYETLLSLLSQTFPFPYISAAAGDDNFGDFFSLQSQWNKSNYIKVNTREGKLPCSLAQHCMISQMKAKTRERSKEEEKKSWKKNSGDLFVSRLEGWKIVSNLSERVGRARHWHGRWMERSHDIWHLYSKLSQLNMSNVEPFFIGDWRDNKYIRWSSVGKHAHNVLRCVSLNHRQADVVCWHFIIESHFDKSFLLIALCFHFSRRFSLLPSSAGRRLNSRGIS